MVYSEQGNGCAFCVGCAIRLDCDTCTCHMHVVDRSLSVAKISVHLQIACTIPLIFCKYAEISASVLLQLNNYMQASMGKSQLSHLGLLQIHYDTFVDLVNVVDCYVQLHQLHCYQPAFINLPLIYGPSIYWEQELPHSNISVQDSDSASVTRNLWQMLIDAAHGEKVTALARLLGDDKSRQLFHAKLVFPIHGIQKQLESGEPLLHQMFHMVSINLQTEISRFQHQVQS